MLKSTSRPRVARNFALFACVVALVAPVATTAQTQTPQRREGSPVSASPSAQPTATPVATTATDNHDLSITANVTARELRFEVVPNPTVEFPGQPRRDTVWEAERTNLPAQVQPGVTYRDIGIRLKITSVFADIERIVAEALGEIPASDNNTPQPPEPNAGGAPPQIDRTLPSALDAAQTNLAPQAAASTQTPRASSASPDLSVSHTSSASPAPPVSRASSLKQTRAGRNNSSVKTRGERH